MGFYKKNQKECELPWATLIQEIELREFVGFLGDNFENVTFEGKTYDQTTINFNDFEELINFPNFKKRHLNLLWIMCESDDRSLRIKFDGDKQYRILKPDTIRYDLKYDDVKWGFAFENEFIERLKNFRPWYNLLTYGNLFWLFPLLLTFVCITIFAFDFLLKVFGFSGFFDIDYNREYNKESSIDKMLVYIFVILIFLAGYILNIIRDYLFPLFIMAIGGAKKRIYKAEKNLVYCIWSNRGRSFGKYYF